VQTACLFGDDQREALSQSIATRMMTRRFPPVVFIDLFLTESCNFACPYCFVEGKQDRHMSWEVATAAVEFLLTESREQDKVEMLLFGGEPQGCGKIQGMDGLRGFLSLGNVFDGFTDLVARAQLTHMGYERRPRCQKCDLQNDCAGGCPAVNWQMTGSIFECHPVDCKFTRAIMGVKDYIQGRLAEEGLKTETQEACERAEQTKSAAVESQGAEHGQA
jgi:radical SAM protein with 4Fe4S-binding SPASM domain